jgi:apolipoprotein N-acyltransferase
MRGTSLLLPVVSGLALWLSFPNIALYPIAWVALVPYLYFLTSQPAWGRTLVAHLLFSLGYFGGILYWIPRVTVVFGGFNWILALGVYALLLLALSLFLLPFTLLTRLTAARSPRQALVCAAGFWLLTEVVRNYYAVNGFPWALLGYSQYPYLWVIQVADIGGVYLVSFLVVMANAALVSLFRFRDWKFISVFATLLVLANAYGIYRAYFWRPDKGPTARIAMVQPNIALAEGTEYYATKYFEELPGFYKRGVDAGANLVIFPEAQNPYFFNQDFYYRSFFTRLVAASGVPLLFNSTAVDSDTKYYNSAFLLDASGEVGYRYDKMHLVPFGEYVPAQQWLNFIEPLVHEVSGFTPGDQHKLGHVGDLTFATLICYEGIFPEIPREFQKRGAGIYVILVNDAWYGRTAAPEQHLQIAAFRAIENRRMVLRAANSGYSAVIDVLGRFRAKSRLFEDDLLIADASGYSLRTPYSYVGEWLNIVLVGVTVPLALMRPRGRGKTAKRRRR